MSKLKAAQTIRKSFTIAGVILKWAAIVAAVVGVSLGLWAWATAHFLSFAIVIGIILAIALVGTIVCLWEWSGETIEEAKKEELLAQERNLMEKRRKENPDRFIRSSYDDDEYYDPTDPLREYH
jgi:hypothetical protein